MYVCMFVCMCTSLMVTIICDKSILGITSCSSCCVYAGGERGGGFMHVKL